MSLDDVGWYASAYLLTTCAFQLSFGKLYSTLSTKYVYLAALLLFEIGSIVCATANTSTALIVGRAVAGIGAAGLFAGSFLITAKIVPLRRRPLYTALIGSMYGIASIVGPLLGGAFTDHATWRWCFWINLPFGAITSVFVVIAFRDSNSSSIQQIRPAGLRSHLARLDPAGLICLVAAVICLLLTFQWAGITYPWSNFRIVVLLCVAGILSIIFAILQYTLRQNATLPLHIMRNRTVLSTAFFAFALGGSFFSIVYFLPLYFQFVRGLSATQSAISNLPMLITMIVLSIISGGVVTKFGYFQPFIVAAAIFCTTGAGAITTLQPSSTTARWVGYQILYGAGIGFGFQQPVIAVQAVLPTHEVAVGTALIIFAQSLGGAIFTSVAQSVFLNWLSRLMSARIPQLAGEPGMVQSIISGGGGGRGIDAIPAELQPLLVQTINDALTRAFYVSLALACAMIISASFVEWRSIAQTSLEDNISQESQSNQQRSAAGEHTTTIDEKDRENGVSNEKSSRVALIMS
jgi:MFS family permease